MTVQEVAEMLGVSGSYVCRMIKEGRLTAKRYGNLSWVISKASVEKFAAKKAAKKAK